MFTIDDDCLPVSRSTSTVVGSVRGAVGGAAGGAGDAVDAIAEHLQNLLSPATPYFFNTVYDPYRDGADFVRGYPYSLRAGVPTAISHGLWMNAYDYDAPTQLLKVRERSERYVDATSSTIALTTIAPTALAPTNHHPGARTERALR